MKIVTRIDKLTKELITLKLTEGLPDDTIRRLTLRIIDDHAYEIEKELGI